MEIMGFRFLHPFDLYGTPLLIVCFGLLLLMERSRPLRNWTQPFYQRAVLNGIVALPAFVVLRLALIPAVVGVGAWAEVHGVGLLNWLAVPMALSAILGFLWLDYSLYLWHRLTHHVAFLWRFHNVHHTDQDLSVTTALRFHFGEMLISIAFRALAVLALGVPPLVVLAYELVFQLSVAFHHSNWALPFRFERMLNRVVVTPRMHGIHHSIVRRETDSNYSSLLTVWDRLHGTLRLDVPQGDITIGVPAYRTQEARKVLALWRMPFEKQKPHWKDAAGHLPDRPRQGDPKRMTP